MLALSIKTTDVRARIEPELKKEAADVLAQNGLTISEAFRLFLRQVVMTRGLPFEVRIPDETTLRALRESEEMRGRARYRSSEDLFDDLDKKD
ncbi:DNA-damage-inducible protein J [Trinickia symbiotica]|uniref:Type II toxin-antitoxin system antitoxin, RelB/DinJ family n=1 Tax=Trinickia symbiotica TaxID=863227 RepID=A0A2N7X021_9BURK|nr:type II toxin-antitoxin system RelB/DinJ family antitoxin [Trinickia symbiotica]PMS34977.1 type II toxin-antitoxin system antitoxin, RelB/DinJ family [Trinickia symbiotica]PPK43462.1 DNA-damage-inducible protein J [Trinickia symbiotica]